MKFTHLLMIVSALILSACTQTADLYFYPDESWKVTSKMTVDEFEKYLGNSVDEIFQEMELPLELKELAGGLSEGGFETLRSYYANQGIDFRWSSIGNTYSFTTKGRTLEQFDNLVPDVLTITKEEEDHYHLKADFTDAMLIASIFYHLDITLHAGEIYSSNAYRQRGGTAEWRNPSTIDVVFSPSSPIPWGVLLAVCAGGLLITIPFFIFSNKKNCPSCGMRVSRKSDHCENCGMDI
jgi:hypothetical protein